MNLNFFLGVCVGFFSFWLFFRIKKGGFTHLGNLILQKAEMSAETKISTVSLELKEKEFQLLQKIQKKEDSCRQREEKLETKEETFRKKIAEIEKKEEAIQKGQQALLEKEQTLTQTIEKIGHFSTEQAKEYLLSQVEIEIKKEAQVRALHLKEKLEQNLDFEVKKILTNALNRLSGGIVSDLSVCTIALPSEEMKGRIIGREGRNIRILEDLLQVNILIDDTPNALLISSFDPIRKQIAKLTLSDLLQDGRIHPTKIEEAYKRAEKGIQRLIKERGEEAALKAGLLRLHPELILLLGKLHFQSNCGQNVLEHSLEVSHIMGLLANELGLDASLAKRIGLLHDIGKALSQDKEGSHAIAGQKIAEKFGEREEVVNGIGCHHDEIAPNTLEASLCFTANMLSANRLGARLEPLENYIKRIRKLEALALQFEGVEKAFALQAGKELRVIVQPEKVEDHVLAELARKLAKKIETDLTFPGKIKITLVREKKAIEYAM